MAEIFQFIPKAELDATANLRGFIEGCRDHLTVFGADLDWDSNEWDVTEYVARRGRNGRLAFVFTDFETAGSKKETKPMAQPFLDFAKAYMRYQHAMKPTKSFGGRLVALRALEKALTEISSDGIPRVEKTDPHVLNYAVQLIQQKAPGSAYQIANQLKTIGELIASYRFTNVPFTWKNPIKKPDDHNIRVGDKAEARRKAKLPSKDALDALAHAFHIATGQRDIIITSMAAIMVSTPDRINELFRLPVNCEHEMVYNGKDRYGLRWWPSKGADPMVKWVVKSMVETAKNAIVKLREHTEEARRMAAWYENNPGMLYLPKGLEYLRSSEYLFVDEIRDIIGFLSVSGAYMWVDGLGLSKNTQGSLLSYAFKDVEKAIVAMLPEGFPVADNETGLKYCDALILAPKNLFHTTRATFRCMFEAITTDTFNNQLGSGTQHGKSSVFSRLGLVDEDGNPFKIRSHQFRHWLNTLAQKKNVDQLTIAMWSGRKDVSQNSAYDNRSPDEILELLRQCDTSTMSDVPVVMNSNVPITREQYMELKYPSVHTTPYGYCVHDWAMLPCQKLRACIDCKEHKCIKGDTQKTERVRQCLCDAEEQLERDEQALEDGYFGVDKWLEFNRKRVERLRNLVQVFDNPEVPEGAFIEVTNENEYSPIGLALNERLLLGDRDAQMLKKSRVLANTATALAV